MNQRIETEKKQKKQIQTLKISQIVPNPKQPRTYFDDAEIEQLGKSILAQGQKERAVVRPIGNDKYELVSGEMRYRACLQMGIPTFEVEVKEICDKDLHFESLIYNAGRHKLTTKEKFYAIVKEVEDGRSIKDIAEAFCQSEVWISKFLTLRNLAPELQALLEHGSKKDCLLITEAFELAKYPNHEYQVKRYQSTKGYSPSFRKKVLTADVKRLCHGSQRDKPSKSRKEKVKGIISSTETFYYFLKELSAIDSVKFDNLLEGMPSLEREKMEERLDDCIKWMGSLSLKLNKLNN